VITVEVEESRSRVHVTSLARCPPVRDGTLIVTTERRNSG